MLEANKHLKSKIKSLSLELIESPFNWIAIRTSLTDLLDTVLSADATVAAHCVLAVAATVSFSLRLKQLLRASVYDIASVHLLVANLFTVGCAGDGDSGDILHSICSAGLPFKELMVAASLIFLILLTVLASQDIDIMDALCAQTRVQLAEDPNAMEFFNTFSTASNISKCDDMKRQIREGYEPGGHRMTALRGSLATASELLSIAFSNSFFTRTGRPFIGNSKYVIVIRVSAPHL